MAEKTAEEKEIHREYLRLRGLFKGAGEKKLKLSQRELESAAFLTVSLRKLEADIANNGYEEEYQNGANQKGIKESTAAKLHIAYTKNLLAVMKQLNERLGEAVSDGDADDEFTRF